MSGQKRFYISDMHFGHANCLSFDNRPFTSVDEMDAELIRRWNSVVSAGDLVYVLGDMFWCKVSEAIPILEQLNGQKFLIKGNHDRCKGTEFTKHFVKIADYMEVEDGDKHVVLCHYPMPCFKKSFYGWYHLYGHVHNSFEWNMMEHHRLLVQELYGKPCEMYNVGVMMPYMNYTPRTLGEITDGYNSAC